MLAVSTLPLDGWLRGWAARHPRQPAYPARAAADGVRVSEVVVRLRRAGGAPLKTSRTTLTVASSFGAIWAKGGKVHAALTSLELWHLVITRSAGEIKLQA